jgi:hypothetical protein
MKGDARSRASSTQTRRRLPVGLPPRLLHAQVRHRLGALLLELSQRENTRVERRFEIAQERERGGLCVVAVEESLSRQRPVGWRCQRRQLLCLLRLQWLRQWLERRRWWRWCKRLLLRLLRLQLRRLHQWRKPDRVEKLRRRGRHRARRCTRATLIKNKKKTQG